jgi:hypothetical protein
MRDRTNIKRASGSLGSVSSVSEGKEAIDSSVAARTAWSQAAVQRDRQRVRTILCGLPTLSLNLKRARTYAERMFRHVVIDNLEFDAAGDALAIPLASARRGFGLSLIGHIVEQTGSYPYLCGQIEREVGGWWATLDSNQ